MYTTKFERRHKLGARKVSCVFLLNLAAFGPSDVLDATLSLLQPTNIKKTPPTHKIQPLTVLHARVHPSLEVHGPLDGTELRGNGLRDHDRVAVLLHGAGPSLVREDVDPPADLLDRVGRGLAPAASLRVGDRR